MDQSAQNPFTPAELLRYNRHFLLPGFGVEGQQKLKDSRVLVVGAGGLGAPLLQYLCAAGVGTIGIIDGDRVDLSNLHRQVLFSEADAGKLKVEAAAARLMAQNPHVLFNLFPFALTRDNALQLFAGYDVIADGTDNFATRYLVNDACVVSGKPNVFASIHRFEGQVSVFNAIEKDGTRGPNYRDLFPEPPPPGTVQDCAEAGVLGVLPGIVGSLQATEVIKLLTGMGEILSGKLLTFDALSMEMRTFRFRRDPQNPLTGDHPTQTGLIDYEYFCGTAVSDKKTNIRQLSAQAFIQMRNSQEPFVLVDVREPHEFEISNLGGILLPLGEIESRLDEIPRQGRVVVHCRSGKRSESAIGLLQEKYKYENLWNLEGGIEAVKP